MPAPGFCSWPGERTSSKRSLSPSGARPGRTPPTSAVHIAARWAVRGFTQALRADLAGTGIKVTLYESGVVQSDYWEHNPGSRERVPKMGTLVPTLTAEAAGKAIVRGIQREQKLVVVPFMMKMTCWQHAVFPGVVQSLMTRTGYKRSAERSIPT